MYWQRAPENRPIHQIPPKGIIRRRKLKRFRRFSLPAQRTKIRRKIHNQENKIQSNMSSKCCCSSCAYFALLPWFSFFCTPGLICSLCINSRWIPLGCLISRYCSGTEEPNSRHVKYAAYPLHQSLINCWYRATDFISSCLALLSSRAVLGRGGQLPTLF